NAKCNKKVVENSCGGKVNKFWKRGEEDASIISTRDACFHMVDKLIAKGLIRQNIIIEPLHSGSSILTYSYSIVSISDNAQEQIGMNEWCEFVKPSSRQKRVR
ncbi:27469_t:CDS:2, partial [Dentiscutata erythropus]